MLASHCYVSTEHGKLWMCQKWKYKDKHVKKGIASFKGKTYKHLSMILDGMDQRKTQIPYAYNKAKEVADVVAYRTSIIGVITHGFEARAYVVEPLWKHDSDLTIEILCRSLLRILEEGLPLAPVWYLQMDNCWRENKNQHVMTFLALLLKLGMFRKIKLNFDLVGHTHEDVDQMFEALNQRLHRKTIGTIEKLMDLLKDGYKNNNMNVPFYAERLDAVGGYKKWIMPFERGMHNHTLPHCFKESPQIASYTVLLLFRYGAILSVLFSSGPMLRCTRSY